MVFFAADSGVLSCVYLIFDSETESLLILS